MPTRPVLQGSEPVEAERHVAHEPLADARAHVDVRQASSSRPLFAAPMYRGRLPHRTRGRRNLGYNDLTGEFPAFVSGMTSLVELYDISALASLLPTTCSSHILRV